MSKPDRSIAALARLLDSEQLARAVPEFAPEVLHHVILQRGLDACTDIVAAATSAQLTSVFDLDLWQPAKPGLDEQLDVSRFREWMEVLVDRDPSLAASTVAKMDLRLAIAAISRYIRVFDPATFERVVPTEEVEVDLAPDPFEGHVCELGGYHVRARRNDGWDAIVLLLHALADDHPERFDAVMRGCRRVSNDRAELDGFHDLLYEPEQLLLDVTLDREDRRAARGYVTPAEARAFLELARRPPPQQHPPRQKQQQQPSPRRPAASAPPHAIDVSDQSNALAERTVGDESNRTRMWQAMRHLGEHDADTFDERMKELAFLAGTLVAGCSLGDGAFTPREAHDAAIAICNLGLEPMPDDFLMSHELAKVFEAGWTVLHQEVSLFAADRLIATLRDLRCHDLDTRRSLVVLERELMKQRAAGTPWRVRDGLDVLAILDMPAWTSLLGLFSECPVLPAALPAILTGDTKPIDVKSFDFISTSDHIRQVHAFMAMLPDVLVR